MTKRAIASIIVLISLIMVTPLSAKGPAGNNNNTPQSALTEEEIHHILHLREEEKLARDVYLTLSELYQSSIFYNISQSEQRHMDAVKELIEKYGLEDPVVDDTVGVFTNPYFAELYLELTRTGGVNYCGALQAGLDIEILDIEDIEIALADIVAQDVARVLNNLLNGSYSHLSAFTSQFEGAECP